MLIAQFRVDELATQFRRSFGQVEVDGLISYAVVFGLLAVLGWLILRQIQAMQSRCDDPAALFRELCEAHEIEWNEWLLLDELAQYHQMSHPGEIFLRPECFEPTDLSPALQARVEELLRLRDRIFGRELT